MKCLIKPIRSSTTTTKKKKLVITPIANYQWIPIQIKFKLPNSIIRLQFHLSNLPCPLFSDISVNWTTLPSIHLKFVYCHFSCFTCKALFFIPSPLKPSFIFPIHRLSSLQKLTCNPLYPKWLYYLSYTALFMCPVNP